MNDLLYLLGIVGLSLSLLALGYVLGEWRQLRRRAQQSTPASEDGPVYCLGAFALYRSAGGWLIWCAGEEYPRGWRSNQEDALRELHRLYFIGVHVAASDDTVIERRVDADLRADNNKHLGGA